MTRRAALLALAARVERASEGSRALDEATSCAVFPELRAVNDGETIWIMHGQRVRILDYSSSLDAALSLVPEGWFLDLHDWRWCEESCWHAALLCNAPAPREGTGFVAARAATPALALVGAALRARAAMEE